MNSKRLVSFTLGFVFVSSSILSLSRTFAFSNDIKPTVSFVPPSYLPGYTPDSEMICEHVYVTDQTVRNALGNLKWGPVVPFNAYEPLESSFPDADVLNLGEKDLIQVDYYSGFLLDYIHNDLLFAQKLQKAFNRGVKIVLNGQFYSTEESNQFFQHFGLDIKQEDSNHIFAPENSIGSQDTGFGQLKSNPSIKATFATVNPYFNINETEYTVVYETIEGKEPIVIDFPVENSKSVIRVMGDIIITTPYEEEPFYPIENIDHSYEYMARLYSCANYAAEIKPDKICLDFENLPDGIGDKTKIKSQFNKSKGFSFKLKQPANTSVVCPGKPQIAMVGGNKSTAFAGFNGGNDTIDPLHADRIGNNFLTDDGKAQFSACTLEVSIDEDFMQNTVTFDIIDINKHGGKQERFLIKAFDAEGNVIKEDTAGGFVPEKGTELKVNGLATEVTVSASNPIAKIQIIPRGDIPAWGVAYDNFCTVK